jgi:Fuc2NAc and GlcNAc transferase
MRKIDFILYLISLIIGAAGGWIISKWGIRLSLMDHPNERSSHNSVTPKGGGIGVLVAFVLVALHTGIPSWFWLPAAGVSVLGLLTDRFDISPQVRLVLQFIAGFIVVTGLDRWSMSGIGQIALILFFSVFVVGTANFYNFMDGINGIAAITSIIGFILLAFSVYNSELNISFITLALCISLACAGFLPFNMPDAKVFMGDVGSILLGFVFAGSVVWLSKNIINFLTNAAFLFPFYADELTTIMARIRDGERLSRPHRRHLYQLLANEYRIPHWKISVGYGFFQLLVGISVLIMKNVGIWAVISALIFYFCAFTMLSIILRKKVES